MATPELCVGAIAVKGDRVLLIRRATPPEQGRWSLPGGRVEFGETMREAVTREVREETGLDAEALELVGWVERIGSDHHFVIADFRVSVSGDADPTAGDDAIEAEWVRLEDLSELPLVAGLLRFLEEHGVVSPSESD